MLAYIPYMDPMGIGSISTIPVSLGWQIIRPICQASRQGLGRGRCWSPGEVVTRNDLAPSHWTSFRHLGCSRWGAWLSDGESPSLWLWNVVKQYVSIWVMVYWLGWVGGPLFQETSMWWMFISLICCVFQPLLPSLHDFRSFFHVMLFISSGDLWNQSVPWDPGALGPRSHYASCIVAGWFGVPKWILLRQGVARDLKQFTSVSMFFAMPGEESLVN